MAEVNLLASMVSLIETLTRRVVTIVAPSQPEEERLAFDEIFADLPSGRVLALQFKKPYERRGPFAVAYTMNVIQQVKLVTTFHRNEAFYALVPYPLVAQFIANRNLILDTSLAVDVHDIPMPGKAAQTTRTIRHQTGWTGSGSPYFRVTVTDPAPHYDEAEARSFRSIAKILVEGKIGRLFDRPSKLDRIRDREKALRLRKLYFVHLSLEES